MLVTVFDVEQLIADCRAAVQEDTPQLAVKEVLDRAVREPAAVLAALPAEWAGATPLYAGDDVCILHVVWAPGMTIRPHDHLMWAAIGLYAGQEDNTFYRRAGGRMERSGGKELRTGDVLLLGDDVVHAVANPLGRYTGAIHVYGGDLTTKQGRIEWDDATQCEVPYDFAGTTRYFEAANAAAGGTVA